MINNGQVDNDIDRKNNVYLSIDITSEANSKVVLPYEQYLANLNLSAIG